MVNLRRAVVLICFALFCVLSVICGFATKLFAASASDLSVKGGASLEGAEVWSKGSLAAGSEEVQRLTFYSFSPYLQFSYSANSIKSEMKFHFDVTNLGSLASNAVVLDKAYVRFRIPTFNTYKLTVIAGKAPISWGMGQLYRGGDLLFSSALSNTEAGSDTENTLWVVSLSHPLFADASIDLAFVPAVEDVEYEKVGALFKFSPQLELLKEFRLAYVYSDSKHKASALLDFNLYFDINVAFETAFRTSTDFRVVANLYKAFSLETELDSHTLSFYLSYQADFYEKTHDLSAVLSYAITDRTTITLLQSNSWTSGKYTELAGALYSTSVLANGVELTVLGSLSTKASSSAENYTITAGARLKYYF